MNVEAYIKQKNNDFEKIRANLVEILRDTERYSELSYDIEELETYGELADLLVENEICQVWDLPYVITLCNENTKDVVAYFNEGY